jgi:AAA domain
MPVQINIKPDSVQTYASKKYDTSHIVLPTQKTKPSQNLSDYLLFIYGEKKIGKTSLCSNFPMPLHIFFEPGGKGLETYAMEPANWAEFVAIVDLLCSESGDAFQTVIIDTADIAYEMCFDFVCDREGFEHPHDQNDFGKSWKKISKEFITQFMRIVKNAQKGMVVLSHAKEAEFVTRYHGTWNKTVPTLSGAAVAWLTGAADLNAYYGHYINPETNKRERRLLVEGSSDIEGGGRMMKHNFRTTSGEQIVSINMGHSDEEAYTNLLNAFLNKCDETGAFALDWDADLTDRFAAAKLRKGKG